MSEYSHRQNEMFAKIYGHPSNGFGPQPHPKDVKCLFRYEARTQLADIDLYDILHRHVSKNVSFEKSHFVVEIKYCELGPLSLNPEAVEKISLDVRAGETKSLKCFAPWRQLLAGCKVVVISCYLNGEMIIEQYARDERDDLKPLIVETK